MGLSPSTTASRMSSAGVHCTEPRGRTIVRDDQGSNSTQVQYAGTGITEETYRKQFRGLKLKRGETPVELVTHLRDLANKWLKDDMTTAQLRDTIIMEKLLTALPEDVRMWVSERKLITSNEAGQLAEDYLQARSAASSAAPPTAPTAPQQPPGKCPKCQQHCPKQRDSPNKCFKCNKPGHLSYQCNSATSLYCDTPDDGSSYYMSRKPEHDTSVHQWTIMQHPARYWNHTEHGQLGLCHRRGHHRWPCNHQMCSW